MSARRVARSALVLFSAAMFAVAALIAAAVWLLTAGRCAWLLTFVFVVGAAALLLGERFRYRPGHQPVGPAGGPPGPPPPGGGSSSAAAVCDICKCNPVYRAHWNGGRR